MLRRFIIEVAVAAATAAVTLAIWWFILRGRQ